MATNSSIGNSSTKTEINMAKKNTIASLAFDAEPARSAPLLHTISTLSSIYSDQSSSYSSSSSSSSSDHEPNDPIHESSETNSDAVSLTPIISPSPATSTALSTTRSLVEHHRSKVRFNVDVQVNETTGQQCPSQKIIPPPLSSMTTGQCSSSCSSASLNSLRTDSSSGSATKTGYMNVAWSNQTIPAASTSQPGSHQFKSILKDPLCAKLRSTLLGDQIPSVDVANPQTPVLTNNNHGSTGPDTITLENTSTSIDTKQLESEIDQLLYGPLNANAPLDMDAVPFGSGHHLLSNTTTYHLNVQQPSQTYIQMIEDKYRQQNSNKFNQSISNRHHSSSSSSVNQKLNPALTKASMTALSNKLPKRPQINLRFKAPGSHLLNHIETHHSGCNMDELMATLLQECNHSNEQQTSSVNKDGDSSRQEQFYKMLSDPIKGPSINKLMSELSGYWSTMAIEHNNPSSSFKSQTGQWSAKSSKSSSSSPNSSTIRSRSLAENHIYEEILYECLQREQTHQTTN